jgi:choline-phosphate cytidylyltransferase
LRCFSYDQYRSEEDNDPLTDDGASSVSVPVFRNSSRNTTSHTTKPSSRAKHQLASSLLSDDGVDSPTYDGDIESSTAGLESSKPLLAPSHHYRNSSGSTLTSPTSTSFPQTSAPPTQPHSQINPRLINTDQPPIFISHPSATSPRASERPNHKTSSAFNPASWTAEDIQAFVKKAIEGESWRKYKVNSPPTDRPVRVYADGLSDALCLSIHTAHYNPSGVYDLFHFG